MDFHRDLWIGLTGGIATGKSTVSNYLKTLGFAVIDADFISHSLVQSNGLAVKELVTNFGQGILNSDGSVSRPKLGVIVFSDQKKLKVINSIMHPLVRKITENKKKVFLQQGHRVIFNDIPLLFENSLQSSYDSTVVVYCNKEAQIQRLKKRNNFSDNEIKKRLLSQMNIEEKVEMADDVINNNGCIMELKKNVDQYIVKLSKAK